ncbi:MAG: flavodoxin-dependent (E)-4-hydroxy-3-methylbut-2-enyl-diphosphate synthase [Candidatus Kapaibacterium sp.]
MNSFERRKTRQVLAGSVPIGGGAPVSVQTMTKTKTSDREATIAQILRCAEAGADIVRVTVNDDSAAEAMKDICAAAPLPVVADIHFNYRHAIAAINAGVAKVRINPGNIGSEVRIKAVLTRAAEAGIPIRIGVNSGSLEEDILDKYGYPTAEALYDSAMRHSEIAEKFGFSNIVIAVKSSCVPLMIKAYRLIAANTDYPLHLGVTEAGTEFAGTIKSSVGIGALLSEGIGDTIRVSLTDAPEKEVKAGIEILKSLGLRQKGIEIISCPTCGRLENDLPRIVKDLERSLNGIKKNISISVLGCAVNGPGEAREADIGVACGRKKAIIYLKGKLYKTIGEDEVTGEVTRLAETSF